MALDAKRALEQAAILKKYRDGETTQLDVVRRYWRGRQALPAVIPSSAPNEVKVMARIARVNVCAIVVDSLAQSTFVDGYRSGNTAADLGPWRVWQANRMDARQTGLHRSTFAYGVAYTTVLPGDPVPVIRCRSPRHMTCVYGEDPDWPMWALERLDKNGLYRLLDDEAAYYVQLKDKFSPGATEFEFLESREHGIGVTPVVRFLDEDDLDADDDVAPANQSMRPVGTELEVPTRGQIAPLVPVQNQIDLTTFGLLVAQWYSAFRQRYAIGWVPADEAERAKAGAAQLWTFKDSPDQVKLGEFEQTNLSGYIDSRKESLRHAASLSQTPAHELIGELVNLSGEALAAAEAGRDRKVGERHTLLGESHEQVFWLVGQLTGTTVPDDAQVKWRDTSARAFSATVDALGKLATLLEIPHQELWERIPGVTQQDVERWKGAPGASAVSRIELPPER